MAVLTPSSRHRSNQSYPAPWTMAFQRSRCSSVTQIPSSLQAASSTSRARSPVSRSRKNADHGLSRRDQRMNHGGSVSVVEAKGTAARETSRGGAEVRTSWNSMKRKFAHLTRRRGCEVGGIRRELPPCCIQSGSRRNFRYDSARGTLRERFQTHDIQAGVGRLAMARAKGNMTSFSLSHYQRFDQREGAQSFPRNGTHHSARVVHIILHELSDTFKALSLADEDRPNHLLLCARGDRLRGEHRSSNLW